MEDSPLKWRVGPGGQHIEMGIAEMNLVLLLGQLGLTLGLPARAPVPDRHALRPVRDARARGHRLLDVLGVAVRAGRHAVRASRSPARAARTSRSRRPGSASRHPGLTYCGAVLRTRARVAAARRPRPHAEAGGRGAVPAALDDADRPGAVPGCVATTRRGAAPGRRRRGRLPAPRAPGRGATTA